MVPRRYFTFHFRGLMLIRLFQQTTRCRVPTTRPTTAGWVLLKRPDKHERTSRRCTAHGMCPLLLWCIQVGLTPMLKSLPYGRRIQSQDITDRDEGEEPVKVIAEKQ